MSRLWVETERCPWQPGLVTAFALLAAAVALQGSAHGDSVRAYIERTYGPSTYKRADADLNGDGRKETIVYFTDRTFCGSGGCTLVILSPRRNGYRVVLRSTVTRLPIMLLATSTHGWRDIGVTVQGGGTVQAYEARLRFNGYRYPSNPTMPPAIAMRHTSGRMLMRPTAIARPLHKPIAPRWASTKRKRTGLPEVGRELKTRKAPRARAMIASDWGGSSRLAGFALN